MRICSIHQVNCMEQETECAGREASREGDTQHILCVSRIYTARPKGKFPLLRVDYSDTGNTRQYVCACEKHSNIFSGYRVRIRS
jgi:hypothetical protein